MNGAHDMGGLQGFGPVVQEADEPFFHAPWERRVFGLTLAMGATGAWNLDRSRHAREAIPPGDYLAASYYEIWLKAVERLLVAEGLATEAELQAGRSLGPATAIPRVIRPEAVAALLARGGPCDRPVATPPRFSPGDAVKTRVMHPPGHTRLPRYARGKTGRVERVAGSFVFPDAHAHGLGEQPQWVYTVLFDGQELWGPAADPALSVAIDAWDSYLEVV